LPILLACAFGVWFFFKALPFTLLPTGDSGTIRGTFLVPEGASPQQQREIQDKLDPDSAGESRRSINTSPWPAADAADRLVFSPSCS
jgi:multidrug efflux pump subunit AcrB